MQSSPAKTSPKNVPPAASPSSLARKKTGPKESSFLSLGKREKKRLSSRSSFFLLLALVLFTAMALLCHAPFLFGKEVLPFAVADTDSTAQSIPFRYLLAKNWSQGNFFWSWEAGLGSDLLADFSYYYSTSLPFLLEVFLLKILGLDLTRPDYLLRLAPLESCVLQVALMLFSYLFFRYLQKQDAKRPALDGLLKPTRRQTHTHTHTQTSRLTASPSLSFLQDLGRAGGAMLSAILFATTAWFSYHLTTFSFMVIGVLWLPLVLLGLERLLRENKPWLFVFSFAGMVLSNYYFAFLNCVFLFFYYFLVHANYRKGKALLGEIFSLAGWVLLSFGLAAIFFLPSILGFFQAAHVRGSGDYPIWPSLPIIQNAWDQLKTWSGQNIRQRNWMLAFLTFSLVLALFLGLADRKKQKKAQEGPSGFGRYYLLSAFLFLLFFFPGFSALMNGLYYLTVRWYYFTYFGLALALCLALKTISDRLFTGKGRHAWFSLSLLGVLALLFLSSYSYQRSATAEISEKHRGEQGLEDFSYWEKAPKLDLAFTRVKNRRVDQAPYLFANSSMYTGDHGLALYDSLIPKNLWEDLQDRQILLNQLTPSYYNGFNHRLFLENAWGLGAAFGPGEKSFGYVEKQDTQGHLYEENTQALGLDLWYTSFLSKSSYAQLSKAEQDTALLQTAVLDPRDLERATASGIKEKQALEKTVRKYPLDLQAAKAKQIVVQGDQLLVEDFAPSDQLAKIGRGKLTFALPEEEEAGEFLLSFHLERKADALDRRSSFSPFSALVKVNDQEIRLFRPNFPYGLQQKDFSVCLFPSDTNLTLEFSPGSYQLSDLVLEFSSYERLPAWTKDRNQVKLEELALEKNTIQGRLENKEPGLLVLNIPFRTGWKAELDGQKLPLFPANGAMTGMVLEAGEHQLKLSYLPAGFLLGATISSLSLACALALAGMRRASGKRQRDDGR